MYIYIFYELFNYDNTLYFIIIIIITFGFMLKFVMVTGEAGSRYI